MFTIIPPTQFVQVPWKNGKGLTTELAINNGGKLTDFDWRISMAPVNEDGYFSDFSGYQRNLVLIEGNGIKLTHDETQYDVLTNPLEIAQFDGHSKTFGKLTEGPILDFNVITNQQKASAKVMSYLSSSQIELPACDLAFVYSPNSIVNFKQDSQQHQLEAKHLLFIEQPELNQYSLEGAGFIVVELDLLCREN